MSCLHPGGRQFDPVTAHYQEAFAPRGAALHPLSGLPLTSHDLASFAHRPRWRVSRGETQSEWFPAARSVDLRLCGLWESMILGRMRTEFKIRGGIVECPRRGEIPAGACR